MNRYGLPRDIPNSIKRVVRQRCKFSCVVCGRGVFQYHHFDPEYVDARQHRAEGITALCGACHDEAGRGLISPDRVRAADAARAAAPSHLPAPLQRLVIRPPLVNVLGRLVMVGLGYLIRIGKDDVFAVDVSPLGHALFTVRLFDARGSEILCIVDNELQVLPNSWDVELSGSYLTIRKASRQIALRADLVCDHGLFVPYLEMNHLGWRIMTSIDDGLLVSHTTTGDRLRLRDAVAFLGGPMELHDDGSMVTRGGTAIVPIGDTPLVGALAQRDFDKLFAMINRRP